MIRMNLAEWQDALDKKPMAPDLRMKLAVELLALGSPFAERAFFINRTSVAAAAPIVQTTITTVPARPGRVGIIGSFDFRYLNPANNAVVDAKLLGFLFNTQQIWNFPARELQNWLTDLFGAIEPRIVIPRESTATLAFNIGAAAGVEPAAYNIFTRIDVRYEPQWVMEALGLVEPESHPDLSEAAMPAARLAVMPAVRS